jgi:hypothetical protein
MNPDWRGEWLSLSDLAKIMGKSYENIKKLHQSRCLAGRGIRIHKVGHRIWIQIDSATYEDLRS